jgi:hypothetical protein
LIGGRKACRCKASREEFVARIFSLGICRKEFVGRIVAQVGSRVKMSLGKCRCGKDINDQ